MSLSVNSKISTEQLMYHKYLIFLMEFYDPYNPLINIKDEKETKILLINGIR